MSRIVVMGRVTREVTWRKYGMYVCRQKVEFLVGFEEFNPETV